MKREAHFTSPMVCLASRCSLPADEDLDQIPVVERRQLCRKLENLASIARNGELCRGAARKQLKLQIRGRIGREKCAHERDQRCAVIGCPFVHSSPIRVPDDSLRLVIVQLSVKAARVGVMLTTAAQACASATNRAKVSTNSASNKTYGVISQYKQRERPISGIIFVPVQSAENAHVSFTAISSENQIAPAREDTVRSGVASERIGFVDSSGKLSLHHDTYAEIAMVCA